MTKIIQDEWQGCYDDSWNVFIVDEAFAHPAKFAYGLINRIVKHMLARGWIRPHETVADPFGGIGTGGIICAANGLRWVGVELESRFVELARKNFQLNPWCRKGECRIIQGDSRNFASLIGQCSAVCTSPPYGATDPCGRENTGVHWGEESASKSRATLNRNKEIELDSYGSTEGQLAALPMGDIGAILTSPSYADGLGHGGTPTGGSDGRPDRNLDAMQRGYGVTPGNLGSMPPGEVSAVIGDIFDRQTQYVYTCSRCGEQVCQNAKIAGSALVVEVDGASRVPENTSAQRSRGDRNLNGGKPKSPPDTSTCPTRYTMPLITITGKAAEIAGADTHGESSDGKHLSATATDVPRAGPLPACSSTISVIDNRLEMCGTIPCAISLHSVVHATAKSTGNIDDHSRICAKCAEANTNLAVQVQADVQDDVPSNSIGRHITGGSTKSLVDSSVGVATQSFHDVLGVQDIAVASVPAMHGKKNSKNTIANDAPPCTYWNQIRIIYEQCYIVLKPGGVLVIVIADFVRKGKMVPLTDDTLKLLTTIGFEPLERIRAMQVKHEDNPGLFEANVRKTTERKSFFRRLAERKGSPPKDFETVLFVRKPL